MLKTYLLLVMNNGTAELHFQGILRHVVGDETEPWNLIAEIGKRLEKGGEEITKLELLSERWRQPDTKTYKVTTLAIGEERIPAPEEEAVVSHA